MSHFTSNGRWPPVLFRVLLENITLSTILSLLGSLLSQASEPSDLAPTPAMQREFARGRKAGLEEAATQMEITMSDFEYPPSQIRFLAMAIQALAGEPASKAASKEGSENV